ncbi:Sec-independent protein translocase TatB [Cellulomonas sp. PhB143]|uniref:Sec-independent protein translocase TatB n=1 Tax=Cellulomonas sp. PhB143 TaxID=2485186 RepID=UPI000F4AF34A|nr:Sec-independent protein translocase TatB [Cellulomonas sp. PhB143]ROS76941.1 sec-independent protein translocase protein TatB [Cellulomonas sp. PhB143]
MFGINGSEFVVLLVLAVVLIGPERLPGYAEQLGRVVRSGRAWFEQAKARVDDELGDEVKDVDWSKLDPRQYDPRRIVRDALMDGSGAGAAVRPAGAAAAAAAPAPAGPPVSPEHPAPWDDEAT